MSVGTLCFFPEGKVVKFQSYLLTSTTGIKKAYICTTLHPFIHLHGVDLRIRKISFDDAYTKYQLRRLM
jgi:hypothetical protein